jgi:hypothetical protein
MAIVRRLVQKVIYGLELVFGGIEEKGETLTLVSSLLLLLP